MCNLLCNCADKAVLILKHIVLICFISLSQKFLGSLISMHLPFTHSAFCALLSHLHFLFSCLHLNKNGELASGLICKAEFRKSQTVNIQKQLNTQCILIV